MPEEAGAAEEAAERYAVKVRLQDEGVGERWERAWVKAEQLCLPPGTTVKLDGLGEEAGGEGGGEREEGGGRGPSPSHNPSPSPTLRSGDMSDTILVVLLTLHSTLCSHQ